MRLFRLILATLLGAGVHALGSDLFPWFSSAIDVFLILAVYHSLDNSVVSSLAGGTLTGLARDVFSGGFYGLHGFANTLIAYLAASIQQRLVIQQPLQVGLLLVLASAAQLAVLAGLQSLLLPGAELPTSGTLLARMATGGGLGTALYLLEGRARFSLDQWREQRRRRLSIIDR